MNSYRALSFKKMARYIERRDALFDTPLSPFFADYGQPLQHTLRSPLPGRFTVGSAAPIG